MAPAASLWAATAEPLPAFPEVAGEVKADVVIIGAGYTGLSAAHHLAKSGLSPIVLEANDPGWGASGRNGGVIAASSGYRFVTSTPPVVAPWRGDVRDHHESVDMVEELCPNSESRLSG